MGRQQLTKNQQIFVDEYLKDRNGTRAYKAAYKTCKRDESARVNASKLLTKTSISDVIAEGLAEIHKEARIEAADIRRELARIGFSDIRNIFDENGRLKRPEEWDDEVAAAVSSVEVVTRSLGEGEVEYVHKIKTWDKKGSLELLGKELKMFTDKVDLSSSDGTMTPRIDASKLSDQALQELMDARNGNRNK
jgi:phage terminase small subunit